MTAIWAGRIAQQSKGSIKILLIDTREKIGAKILMSGGTRCNVTNREVKPSDFQGGPSHFVKHVFEAFTPQDTKSFFKEIGVELILEPPGKYFPVTHSAQSVLDALVRETHRLGIELLTGLRITEIHKQEERFHLRSDDGNFQATAQEIILTPGGLSYPTTGSDGTGYGIAKTFGHTIVDTFPALTPLLTSDPDWKQLSGLSLDARLSFFKNGSKECEYRGPFLFTHFGFSGPTALDISRHYACAKKGEDPQIMANFLPSYQDESLKNALQDAQKKSPNKSVKNWLTENLSLPNRFAETLLKKIGLQETTTIGNCPSKSQKQLKRLLLNYSLEVDGVFGYKKAEVTAGGVDLGEISVSTMESKLVKGLYFAGEIMNVDGRIGGFNFQWAWSTGAVAGRSAARSLIS